MNITFLVGNGFDVRMGIKSGYKDVEDHYCSLSDKPEVICKFQNEIRNSGRYWSNFETAMGKYTGKFGENELNIYRTCMDDFTTELYQYLESEEAKIDFNLCKSKIAEVFVNAMTHYNAELGKKYQFEIARIIQSRQEPLTFNFISFNYTSILDKCLGLTFDKSPIGQHKSGNGAYSHYVNQNVIHVHGRIPDSIVMGVDNDSQIANPIWAKNKRFGDCYIKPAINARDGNLADEDADKLINESTLIYIFGMSLGETDKTWWKKLGIWLEKPDHRLIIYGHNPNYSKAQLTHNRKNIYEDGVRDRFLDLADIPEEKRDSIEGKIYVVYHSSLFDVDLVKLTQSERIAKVFKPKQSSDIQREGEKELVHK